MPGFDRDPMTSSRFRSVPWTASESAVDGLSWRHVMHIWSFAILSTCLLDHDHRPIDDHRQRWRRNSTRASSIQMVTFTPESHRIRLTQRAFTVQYSNANNDGRCSSSDHVNICDNDDDCSFAVVAEDVVLNIVDYISRAVWRGAERGTLHRRKLA